MIKVNQRPIQAQEKEKLQSILPGFWKRIEGFVVKFLLIFMFSILPLLLLEEMLQTSLLTKGWFAFLWSFISVMIALALTWREEKVRSVIVQELEEGQVETIICEADEVFMMEISGSLGIVYIFPCGPEKTLIFNDTLLEIFQLAPDSFPNTKFELILSPVSRCVLGIDISGEFIIPKIAILQDPTLQKAIKNNHYLIIEKPVASILNIPQEN
jgi:hypothetical protein